MTKKSFWSRRAVLKGVGIVSFSILAAFPAVTLAKASDSSTRSHTRSRQKGAVGSWSFVIKFTNGSQERSLGAFTSDGIATIINEQTKAPGFGVWESTGFNTFTYNFREPVYDVNNNLIGEVHVVQTAILEREDNKFESTGKATVYDFSGKLIAVETTTAEATRIEVESP
jgi:hypothetical protein